MPGLDVITRRCAGARGQWGYLGDGATWGEREVIRDISALRSRTKRAYTSMRGPERLHLLVDRAHRARIRATRRYEAALMHELRMLNRPMNACLGCGRLDCSVPFCATIAYP